MTGGDVNAILQRLAIIETEVKGIRDDNEKADGIHAAHGDKIERLQLALAFVAGIAASAGGTSVLSLVLG